jgi:hypothetical protein
MAVDFEILKEAGTTNERLRDVLSATPYSHQQSSGFKRRLGPAETKRLENLRARDIDTRKQIENLIMSRLSENVVFALRNHHFYSAVDIAWDATPINKQIIPLMLYAQKRIDISACAKTLSTLGNGDAYVRKNEAGAVIGIDLPKFYETNINLLRSIVTRRVAAQDNKFRNLYPFYKFESRTTGLVGKLRADAVSQKSDETADQYGWRYSQEQEERDVLLYGTVMSFPTAAWEREVQWVRKPQAAEFETGKVEKQAKVVKEGFGWTIPHPSRTFYDNNYPIWTINTDSGCEWCGFWDVERYGDVYNNPAYFNREAISYSQSYAWLVGYEDYFSTYYDTLTPPPSSAQNDYASGNDRKTNIGIYTGDMRDTSVFTAHYYWKIKPVEWGIGTYPYPVWVHLKVAGDCTAVFAEIMPSSPGAVTRFNCSDNRMLNNAVAHDLLGFQDQLTNLFTQLYEAAKADMFAVAVINEDFFGNSDEGKKVLENFKAVMAGRNYYATMQVLLGSFEKLRELGLNPTMENIFKVVRSAPNTNIETIFKAIARTIEMAERLLNLSPQEQGQPAPREITAEETRLIGGTTESVYSFISSALDASRAAKKRIWLESYLACGSEELIVPIVNRYPKEIVAKAGFRILDEDIGKVDVLNEFTIAGRKGDLVHDYIFTTRDGADRSSDAKGAEILGKVLQGLGQMQPELAGTVFGAMGKRQLFNILNAIFRGSGAGQDVILELAPGEDDSLEMSGDGQLMGTINQLAQMLKRNTMDVQQLKEMLGAGAPGPTVLPGGPAAAPAPALEPMAA